MSNKNTNMIENMKVKLQALWIFVIFNYAYADIHTIFDKTIVSNMSQGALLGSAVLMETSIVMVVLTRILPYRSNRWANIVVGVINTLAVLLSLTVSGKMPALYYLFFAVIEIVTTLVIVWLAWNWPKPEGSPNT